MGVTAGFDITDPISSEADSALYARFIADIRRKYTFDPNVHFQVDGFFIVQGEVPRMPYDGTLFRRFDSKISGHFAQRGNKYLTDIRGMFERHFGEERVEEWVDCNDEPSRGLREGTQGWYAPLDDDGKKKHDDWERRTRGRFEKAERGRRKRDGTSGESHPG